MANITVSVTDANNITVQLTPVASQTITIDRGVAGNGISSIVPVTISMLQYLRIFYTNGTQQDVGPLTSTAYAGVSPIDITGNTISLLTVPINKGGTNAITAAAAIQNLLPSYTGNGSKRLSLNSGATALEWVLDGGGTVTSVDVSGGTTGLTTSGGPITGSGTITLAGTLGIANGGTNGIATPTAGAVPYGTGTAYAFTAAGTAGQILQSNGASAPTWANLSSLGVSSFSAGTTGFTPSTATTGAVTLAGTLATTNGGTGLTSFTNGGIVYASSTSALSTGSALVFDGANLGVGTSSPLSKLDVRAASAAMGNYQTIQAFSTDTSAAIDLGGGISLGGFYNSTQIAQFGSIAGRKENGTSGNYAGYLSFGTNSQATGVREVMRIDSSGNLGLGVTPSANAGQSTLSISNYNRTFSALTMGSNANSAGYVGYNMGNTSTSNTWKYISADTGSALYFAGNEFRFMQFASGSAGATTTGTQAMTLDASGNWGIGTTSPSFRLHAVSSAAVVSRIGSSGGSGAFINFIDSGASPSVAPSVGAIGNSLVFMGDGSSSERARIDSSGNLLVGAGITSSINGTFCPIQALNNTANQVAYFRNSNANPSGTIVNYSGASPNNTGNEFVYCSDSTAQRASFRSNGGVANYSANNVNLSDRREKTNFAPAKSYLDVICAIPVQTFNYIDQNMEDDGGLTLGVVAQDVQAVAPELVMESNWAKDGDEPKMRLSIYQTDLQYALMKCIQEQQALITQLTARITALEGA